MRTFKEIATIPILTVLFIFSGCSSSDMQTQENKRLSDTLPVKDTVAEKEKTVADSSFTKKQPDAQQQRGSEEKPVVTVYNFHLKRRCPSCIAIEEATEKTIITYFSDEVKEGRVKRQVLNIEENGNDKIAEKYGVFGSALILSRVFKGKETIADLTGEGFKFAKNKEERFIEILKNKIQELLQ